MTRRSLLLSYLLFIGLHSPNYAQKPELVVPIGHTNVVEAVYFSPRGQYAVSGSRDNTLRLWDVQSGRLIRTFEGHTHWVSSVAISSDGRSVVSGSWDKTLKLWDVQSGRLVRTLKGHTKAISSVVISDDGRSVASAARDSTIMLWDVQSGRLIRTFEGHTKAISSIAITSDGRSIVSGSWDKTLKLWDVSSGQLQKTFEGHADIVSSVVFSPDGRFVLSGSSDKTLRLWDISNGRLQKTFKGDTSSISSVAFSPDGRFVVSGSWDKTLKLWNVSSGELVRTFEGHTDYVSSVAFSPDGQSIVSGSGDKSVKIWDVNSGRLVRSLVGHTDDVFCVAISPDARAFLTGSRDKTLRLWDANIGKLVRTFEGHIDIVSSVAFSPDGRSIISASLDKTLKLWNINSGQLQGTFESHADNVFSMAFSSDGRSVVSGSRDKTLKLWDVNSGELQSTFAIHASAVTSVAFSPDGRFVVSGSWDKTLKLWNVSSGELVRTFEGHTDYVSSVAFSPDGQSIVSGSGDKSVKIWDVNSGRLVRSLVGHTDYVSSVTISPDGRYIVSASRDKNLKLWDLKSGIEIRSFRGHASMVRSVAFSYNGSFFISSSFDSTTKLWNTNTGKEIATLVAIDSTDWAVTTPDGLFDASPGAMKQMHYVVNDSTNYQAPWKVIELDNLKQRYYQPGLLPILMGYGKYPLRQVPVFEGGEMPPAISLALNGSQLRLQLQNRKGGIGVVTVSLNGAELVADLRTNPAQDSIRSTLNLSLDLSPYARRLDTLNQVSVVAYNAEGWIRSRPQTVTYRPPVQTRGGLVGGTVTAGGTERVQLRAVVVGTSNVGLRFAHYDAEQMANGLRLAAGELLGPSSVQVQLLTSREGVASPPARASVTGVGTVSADTPATRSELIRALEIAKLLKPQDVFVLYLSGHGVNYGGTDGDFYYLTAGATSADAEYLKDPAIRQQYALSSSELVGYLNQIPARKKLLVLDVCAAGRGAEQVILASRGGDASQIRALDRLQERTGFYVLAGSAANAVSYEANVYGQGLLTYALLKGMKGASVRQEGINKFLDVERWLGYAVEQVPQLARGVGGIQQPFYRSGTTVGLPGQQARSFDIGKITEQVQRQIYLAEPKPVLLVESFQDTTRLRDVLDLSNQVRTALIDLSARGTEAPVAYIAAKDYPGAYVIGGRYTVQGESIAVNCAVFRGEKQVGTFASRGTKANLSALAVQILTKAQTFISH